MEGSETLDTHHNTCSMLACTCPSPAPTGPLSGAPGELQSSLQSFPSEAGAPESPQARLAPPQPRALHFPLHLSSPGNDNAQEETREVGSLKWRRRSTETFPNVQKELFGIINQHVTNTKGLFHIRRRIIKETIAGLLCILFLKNANYV